MSVFSNIRSRHAALVSDDPLPGQARHILATTSLDPGAIVSLDEIRSAGRYALERACRRSAQPLYLGNGRLLCRVLGRYKVYLHTSDRGFAAHVALDGYWEMWLTQMMAQWVKPGMDVVDVGANYGYYSVLLADLVGESGYLTAIEPNPAAAEMLNLTVELNGFAGRSTILTCAAGAVSGEAELVVPVGEPKNATLMAAPDLGGRPLSHHVVAVRALDEILEARPRIDFLKIDTEGAEEDVVTGMAGCMARDRPDVVLEFNPQRCRDPQGLLARLRTHYPVLRTVGFSGEPAEIEDAELLDPTNHEDRLIFLSARVG